MNTRPIILLAGAAVLAACSGSSPTEPNAGLLTTDSSSYTAVAVGNGEARIRVVTLLRNASSSPIELPRCFPTTAYPIYGVELVSPANSEGAAWDPAWACVGHDKPIVIAPQTTRTDTLMLRAPSGVDGTTQRPLGVLSGRFRIRIGPYRSNEIEIKLPAEGLVPAVSRDLTAAIQTDQLLVSLNGYGQFLKGQPIRATIYNPRPDTSFIVNCNGATALALEKQYGTEWRMAWVAAVPGCGSAAIVIAPGGHYDAVFDISGGTFGSNVVPQFGVAYIPGVYRMVFSRIVSSFSMSSPISGTPIAVELRRSNPFAIIVDP
jgi:hypothetical protein